MTSKLTREQLRERARENVKALKMAARQHAFESAREEILADLQLAEQALAAMDSEPVANAQLPISRERLAKIISWRSKYGENANVMLPAEEAAQLAAFAQYVLDAQPVADVVAWSHPQSERKCDIRWRQFDVHPGPLYSVPQPARVYPETLPCPVLIEPGLRFSAGIKTSTFLAALARRAVHESELAALSPDEKVEVKERIEDFKKFITRPVPVVPDEWTLADAVQFCKKTGRQDAGAAMEAWNACRAAMLAGNEPVSFAYRLGQGDITGHNG